MHERTVKSVLSGPSRRFLLVLCSLLAGCGSSEPPAGVKPPISPSAALPPAVATPMATPVDSTTTQAALARLPHALTLGEECPIEVPHSAEDEKEALVPLEAGLTLSSIWTVEGQDFECLKQVTAVNDFYIEVTGNCPSRKKADDYTYKRRLCQSDLHEAYFYLTQTARPGFIPTVASATMFSLSSRSLRELKTKGITRHRYIEFANHWQTLEDPMVSDYDASLVKRTVDRPTASVIINDAQVELPVIHALTNEGGNLETNATIVDDERFPLVLDYRIKGNFSIQYTKISYPNPKNLEQRLAVDKRVDVYGIYFDFASDRLRPESAPVLAEIAGVLAKNDGWKLDINGHTDNVGGDAANLSLSRLRAQAVMTALVRRYGIAAERLSIGGFGASQPQATNDTPEGRARNRRVELVRR